MIAGRLGPGGRPAAVSTASAPNSIPSAQGMAIQLNRRPRRDRGRRAILVLLLSGRSHAGRSSSAECPAEHDGARERDQRSGGPPERAEPPRLLIDRTEPECPAAACESGDDKEQNQEAKRCRSEHVGGRDGIAGRHHEHQTK